MASNTNSLLPPLMLLIFISFRLTVQGNKPVYLSFPLTSAPLSRYNYASKPNNNNIPSYQVASIPRPSSSNNLTHQVQRKNPANASSPSFNYSSKSSFKYSMALIVSLPIGTPPQVQRMVVDTGSQLSWIQCHWKKPDHKQPPSTPFDPSISTSFSLLPCNHPACKPLIPDFTLPTTCDQNHVCHYSYFYADGTLAEGNLAREKFSFSGSRSTPPLILGCAAEAGEAEGILGMNLGRLSFVSQAKVPRFSYCVPIRQEGARDKINIPTGTFYLGQNPNSRTFQYINLSTFPQSQHMPNFDPLAYTVRMVGIKIGMKKLDISEAVFRPDAGGSGQTIIDSGTQYTFLVNAAYAKMREEVVRLVGAKLKKDYTYRDALDMCFDGNAMEIGRLIGVRHAIELLGKAGKILISSSASARKDEGQGAGIEPNFFFIYTWSAFNLYSRLSDMAVQQLLLVKNFASSKSCDPKHLLEIGLEASQGPQSNHEVATFALNACLASLLASPSPDYQTVALVLRKLISIGTIHKGDTDDDSIIEMYKHAYRIMVGLREGEYPIEEAKWLATTAWNRAAVPVKMGKIDTAKKWMNVGLELAMKVPGMHTYKSCMEDYLAGFEKKLNGRDNGESRGLAVS